VRGQRPDLVIVDIRMPPQHETEGLDVALLILVLPAHAEVEEAMELLSGGDRVGVHSILNKLPLAETADDHRRVLAVITFLETR
jgi:hypothetical protein